MTHEVPMPRPLPLHISLPIADPLALIDATLLFLIQVLIAKHPDLLAAPEEGLPTSPGSRAARHILDAIREVHRAVETYSAFLPSSLSTGNDNDDDIPF
jgi:hypothetical protein